MPEGLLGHPSRPVLQNVRVLAEYIRIGWESGIYNEFRELQMRGMTRAQIIEVVMYAQLSGGRIRGMGHVHSAVGKSLFDWRDGSGLVFPEGWAADPKLAKAWGFTPDWVVEPICGQALYFKGLEALEAAYDAIDDILDRWDSQ